MWQVSCQELAHGSFFFLMYEEPKRYNNNSQLVKNKEIKTLYKLNIMYILIKVYKSKFHKNLMCIF